VAVNSPQSKSVRNGTNLEIGVPEMILFTNVVAIAAGSETSLFIRGDGSLWGTGEAGGGQLGFSYSTVPSSGYVLQPVMIKSNDVVAIASGMDASLYIQATPLPPQPVIVSAGLSNANLTISATNGVASGSYVTLMSPTLTQPVSQWKSVATNVLVATLNATGSFTITVTNIFNPTNPAEFFILSTP